jgi:phosphoglycerate dehydrogenase-like enzyme
MKVLIPDSLELHMGPDTSDITWKRYSASADAFEGDTDAQMIVLWNNSERNLHSAVKQLSHLRLVQTLAAGPDHALGAGFSESIQIASGRGLHDDTVVEHALALTLAAVRNLSGLAHAQAAHHWDSQFSAAQANPETAPLYTLHKAKVLIYGFGSIAEKLAPLLKSLGAEVTGVANTPGPRSGFPVLTTQQASDVLPEYDIVISLLPYSKTSENFFSADFFSSLKKSCIFINVGRGKTVDETALVNALKNGKIRGAAIDVTRVEPLSEDSELWDCPSLTITPHIAGGRPRGSELLIQTNAEALLRNSPIKNLVSRTS